MSSISPIFVLAVPSDYDWTAQLVRRLSADGHFLYLEPQNDEPNDQSTHQFTADALYNASAMLVVISQDSALGDSSDVFEAWWRPFMQDKRPIIVALVPDAPSGAEHWMPFDLRHFPRVDFQDKLAYETLKGFLTTAVKEKSQTPPRTSRPLAPSKPAPVSPPMTSRAKPQQRGPRPQPSHRSVIPPRANMPSDLPLPPASASYAMEKADIEREERRLWRNLLGWPVVLVLLVVLWVLGFELADQYTEEDAFLAIVAATLIGLITGFIIMGFRVWGNRASREQRKVMKTYQRSQRRPEVYVEIISSTSENDLGQIWPITQFAMTIGRSKQADMVIHDKHLAKKHCIIFYDRDDGQYYLENLSDAPTVLYDSPLRVGDVQAIENGDLIVLGKSVVLQFRSGF